MNLLRSHRRPLAWMLLAFILFNGFACSLGHGELVGAPAAPTADHLGKHHAGAMQMHGDMQMPMPAGDDHGSGLDMSAMMKLFGDCAFGGTLAMALIFFVALGWLLRTRAPRPFWLPTALGLTPRQAIPCLNPQAP